MYAILSYYVLQARYDLTAEKAGNIYSWFYFSIYALALVGGILADATRKYKTVIMFGIIIVITSYSIHYTKLYEYTLKNANGVEMDVITYGGRIISLKVPDKNGKIENVVLGYNSLEDYLNDSDPFFGALIVV